MKKINKNTKSFHKKEIVKLKRKLLKLWSETVRELESYTCIYCKARRGETSPLNHGTLVKIDAHHLLQKDIKNSPLKYDIRNSAVLCSSCHKFNGEHSAHKSPIVFYDWFRNKYPDKYDFILKNSKIRVDLDNYMVLKEIERCLINKQALNIDKLKEIEKQYTIIKKEIGGSLFDSDSDSSSSSY